MEITVYNTHGNSSELEEFVEACILDSLQYRGSEFWDLGMDEGGELAEAINRAIRACKNSGLSVEENFRSIYIVGEHGILKDWMLSVLARRLILLNANPSNPIVARLQIKLLKNIEQMRHETEL
ncbi:MAG TPA: hypothetical protein VFL70_04385 [Bacteroidia bacterium]|nr:hypothetical protein [Bacteroidia bacterium]